MSQHELPEVLPVFPLTGVLLLPGMWLPLNVFEPRYRAMVRDALEGPRHIGMVQPVVPRQDNAPPPDAPPENPELYPVGCAGIIDQWEKEPDGRYTLSLKGVCRFRIREELAPHDEGYRRVVPEFAPFAADMGEHAAEVDAGRLLYALEQFGRTHRMPFDLARLQSVSGIALLNGLAMSLPFRPAEKQALLEAPDVAEREELLLTLMGMGVRRGNEVRQVPPTLN